MVSGPLRSCLKRVATRVSATAEGGARLADPFRVGETALGGQSDMNSGTKVRSAPLFRRNQRVRTQKNVHFSGRGLR